VPSTRGELRTLPHPTRALTSVPLARVVADRPNRRCRLARRRSPLAQRQTPALARFVARLLAATSTREQQCGSAVADCSSADAGVWGRLLLPSVERRRPLHAPVGPGAAAAESPVARSGVTLGSSLLQLALLGESSVSQRWLLARAKRQAAPLQAVISGDRARVYPALQWDACWKQATSYCATTCELPELSPPWLVGFA
jgi:hypothetical protein